MSLGKAFLGSLDKAKASRIIFCTGIYSKVLNISSSADIPSTVLDLSTWIPMGAIGILVRFIGSYNVAPVAGNSMSAVVRDETPGNRVCSSTDFYNPGVVTPFGKSTFTIVPLRPPSRSIRYNVESSDGAVANKSIEMWLVGYIL